MWFEVINISTWLFFIDHPFLLAAFNHAFSKNLLKNKNSNEGICNNTENELKIFTIEPEACR